MAVRISLNLDDLGIGNGRDASVRPLVGRRRED